MNNFDGTFARRLYGKIEAERIRRTAVLLDGKAQDLAEYRGQVEFMKALTYVIDLMDATQKSLSHPDPRERNVA
jgi:hypothetical protein